MEIVCISCNEKVFKFLGANKHSGDMVEPSDFQPLDGSTPPQRGQPMLCPKCGAPFSARNRDGGVSLYLGKNAWWPYPPWISNIPPNPKHGIKKR